MVSWSMKHAEVFTAEHYEIAGLCQAGSEDVVAAARVNICMVSNARSQPIPMPQAPDSPRVAPFSYSAVLVSASFGI
jgi:hypothetical protein